MLWKVFIFEWFFDRWNNINGLKFVFYEGIWGWGIYVCNLKSWYGIEEFLVDLVVYNSEKC